jgi:HlyD family secretion protein
MRMLLKLLIVLGVLVGLGTAAYLPARNYWKERHRPVWRLAEVKRGRIITSVNSTGTIKPVLSVSVGSFVSGPVQELYAEFNQEVKKDQLLAKIDPQIYEANAAQSRAALKTKIADVERAQAMLDQASHNEDRAQRLREEDETFVAAQEMDTLKFNRLSFAAQLKVAEAAVEQAQAALDYAEAQLKYTEILSPVDGMVINRKIDPGQTLAAQFQTPELFIVAPDMRKKMHIHALVDEADIGMIRRAQREEKKVIFTVDAYLDDLFEGIVEEVRLSSTTTQNVVTYPVIVAAPNPDLKLLPGMTANISFQVEERSDVVKIPNAALRFYPKPEQVREEDRQLLEGLTEATGAGRPEASEQPERILSADERAELRRKRNKRHVWLVDGEFLKAVEVITGISDSQFTEMVQGPLTAGQSLVTGLQQ